jgi:hypothetical protein
MLAIAALVTACLSLAAAGKPPESTTTTVNLTVQPMAAPRPALKVQLLPELREINPGNPIFNYLRCYSEQQNFFFGKESVDNRERWQTMPLADLPVKELRGYGGGALRQADYAARLDSPDWQILQKAKSEGFNLLVPDLQHMRQLASCLKVRFRAEVAERRFDDAVATAKTMFALSRHVAEHPTLIGGLVGIAIANVAIGPLEEMIQQPGCPNLYWALTDLPSPFVDLRRGLQGERLLADAEFAGLDSTAPMSEAQLGKIATRVIATVQQLPDVKRDAREWLDGRTKDEKQVRAGRQRLVASGLAEAEVKQFPALQVILLDDKRAYEVRRDELTKAMALPYWQFDVSLLDALATGEADDTLFGKWEISGARVKKAQARLDQQIGLLRHVEAIRLYAASHEGKPPAHLEDLTLPLPLDPFSGKPFVYEVDGQTVTLCGSPPRGEVANPAYNLRFVVTIKK